MAQWISLSESAALIGDGCQLALGGMTNYRRPMAFVRALLARHQPPRQITLISFTAGMESDLLIGAGLVSALHTCYAGLEIFGLAPMYTDAAANGRLRVIDESETSLALGLRARSLRVGYLPSPAWTGTDLLRVRPDVHSVRDPYSGESVQAFPAIQVDVAVIHALEGDEAGHIKLNNNLGVDPELIFAADVVIATVERRVDRVRLDETGPAVPSPGIDFLALAPSGAWPTSCFPLYPIAGGELVAYVDACTAGTFDAYLKSRLDPAADDQPALYTNGNIG